MATRIRELPDVEEAWPLLTEALPDGLLVLLDFDGTLAPIVDDPGQAQAPPAVVEDVRRLASAATVAVISGRDVDDVRARTDVPGVIHAGSHGLDLRWPDGRRERRGEEAADALAEAAERLEAALRDVPGVRLERKALSLAVHDRQVGEADRPRVERAVATVADALPGLRRGGGKRVHELRPAIDWDKGEAARLLLARCAPRQCWYLGDDRTDEDAFAALADEPAAVTVVVDEAGTRESAARYWAAGVPAAQRVVARLASAVGRAAGAASG